MVRAQMSQEPTNKVCPRYRVSHDERAAALFIPRVDRAPLSLDCSPLRDRFVALRRNVFHSLSKCLLSRASKIFLALWRNE